MQLKHNHSLTAYRNGWIQNNVKQICIIILNSWKNYSYIQRDYTTQYYITWEDVSFCKSINRIYIHRGDGGNSTHHLNEYHFHDWIECWYQNANYRQYFAERKECVGINLFVLPCSRFSLKTNSTTSTKFSVINTFQQGNIILSNTLIASLREI